MCVASAKVDVWNHITTTYVRNTITTTIATATTATTTAITATTSPKMKHDAELRSTNKI